MCGHAVKKHYLLKYVPDQCETRQMCHEDVLVNCRTLKSFPDCYKNQQMCNKAIGSYPHTIEMYLINI